MKSEGFENENVGERKEKQVKYKRRIIQDDGENGGSFYKDQFSVGTIHMSSCSV